MIKTFVRFILNLIKGRSARHTHRSDLDNFIHHFESKRDTQPLSRQKEIEQARQIAHKRDNFSAPEKSSFLDS